MAIRSERLSNIHVDPISGARARSCISASVAALVVCLALTPAVQAAQIDISGPLGSGAFGTFVDVLPNGNIVVVDPSYTIPEGFLTFQVGAVYVYDPAGNLISTLTGSIKDDAVGSKGVVKVGNGNFVVLSPNWNSASASAGAITWVNGTTGLSGMVSASNSLVGTTASSSVTTLTNGNYVVASQGWNGSMGAATWGGGNAGVTGTISSGNSLVGDAANDNVGTTVVALSNGNYVVASPFWNFQTGAATWGDGTTGVKGTISSSNSLVGSRTNDEIGLAGITALSNGNYVVRSYAWNASSGAATWGNGATGTTGTVSSTNSLTGLVGDEVGAYVTVLTDGNYVVVSPNWNGNLGAATWGSGTTGVTGTVSSSNSLVGAAPNDSVGSGGIASLSNGNYVVASLYWSGNRGAATWGSGTAGVTGAISASNSLVGAAPNDYVGIGGIAALSNGNYVVGSPDWSGNTGAATLCNGANGTTGMISSSNSLVGTFANDKVGYAVLSLVGNGNYVVGSPYWGGNVGAVTWGSGISGVVGTISSSNSLIGSAANDYVGGHGAFQLNDGNYMVISPNWGGNLGASTWGNGAVGAHGLISSSNSLIGSAIGDEIGLGVPAVFDDDYVLVSPGYGGVGAVTMASNAYRLVGQIQSWNSVIGVASSYLVPLPLAYDSSRRRLVVGRPADNKISLFTAEQIFAANFDP